MDSEGIKNKILTVEKVRFIKVLLSISFMPNHQVSTSPTKNVHQKSLLEALLSIRFLLSHENEARFIAAKPTLSELKGRQLPNHLRMSVKKRNGPRIRVRSSRSSRVPQMVRARWPSDHLIENTLPSIACVVRGAADLRIADYVMHCQTGDIIFYAAGLATGDGSQSHFDGDPAGRRCSLLWIFPGRINGEGLECYICHSQEQNHSSEAHLRFRNRLLAELFQGICEEEQKPNHRESVFHLISAILFLLQREITSGNAVYAPYNVHLADSRQPGQDLIQQACTYVDRHLDSNLTISSVARHVCLSPSVFTKRFKQETGQTFNQYCTASRMKRAAILLRETELRIIEISRSVGFTDCQFRLLARKHWGCTPGEFRTKNN